MRWKFVTWLTIKATDLSNILLRNRNWKYTMKDYKKMPIYSVGREIYEYMNRNNIPFKPNLARHDVKHIILGYEMKMPDELRIHSFMLGNRCNNLMGIIYLMVCSAFVPEVIPQLIKDYKRGRRTLCLKEFDLEKLVAMPLNQCRTLLKL